MTLAGKGRNGKESGGNGGGKSQFGIRHDSLLLFDII
jgi:hypothetical protein